jgi:hypothetical protein
VDWKHLQTIESEAASRGRAEQWVVINEQGFHLTKDLWVY